MDQLIKEIMSSLENKNYLSALALTLTLPDICGKIAYPNMKHEDGSPDIGGRYAKWYNENIYNYDVISEMKDLNKFDGHVVYKLRCLLLHNGSLDIERYFGKKKYKKNPSKFVFELTNTVTYIGEYWVEDQKNSLIRIRIGVEDFCRNVCSVAEMFYNEHPEEIYNNIVIYNFD